MGQETKYSQEEILELRQTQFAEALRKADAAKANELYEHIHPVDLAEAMEDWEEELLSRFCGLLEDEKLAELLEGFAGSTLFVSHSREEIYQQAS